MGVPSDRPPNLQPPSMRPHTLLFLIFTGTVAMAGTEIHSSGVVSLALDGVADHALARNPHLAAARLRIEEARGRVLGSGRLRNPEIEVDYLQNVHTSERAGGVAFVQRFPITARLRLEKAVSRVQLAAAEAEVRDAERKLVAEARGVAVKLLALDAQREVRRQQLANSGDQTEFVAKRVERGEASSLDVAQIELEADQLNVELLQLDIARATLTGELRPLLGVPPLELIEITGTLTSPRAAPKADSDVEHRPDLEAARLGADAAAQAVSLAKSRRWEDVGVGIIGSGERTEDAPDGLSNDYFLGLKVNLPLPLWNRNEGQIAEAEAAAARTQKEADALTLTIRSEVAALHAEMAALARLVSEMDTTLLPKATQVEEQLRAAYDAGQLSFSEALRARARRLELAQRRVDALRDYHLARVRYEAAVGLRTSRRDAGGK